MAQKGCLLFNFPGFANHASKDTSIGWPDLPIKPVMPAGHVTRRKAPTGLSGIWVENKPWGMSYVLAAIGESRVRTGGGLGFDGRTWNAAEQNLPPIADDDGGSSLAIPYDIPAGESKVIRMILAWFAPEWEGNGNPGTGGSRISTYAPEGETLSTTGKRFTHMYASRFADAGEVASYLARNHEPLLARVIAWQSAIYEEKTLPGWLADSLINALYYFAPCSMWAQAKDPIGNWCRPEDGLFALEESPRACPHMSTLSNVGMQGPTLSFFFPDCALSLLRAIRSTQRENGDVAQLMGRWSDPANPMSYDYQEVVSGFCYVSAAYLHWKITGDEAFMKEFYPSVKKALRILLYTAAGSWTSRRLSPCRRNGAHAWNDIEWFEDRSMYGYVTHPGGLRIAGAEMLKTWAQAIGDGDEVRRMDEFIAAGKDALQKYLWKSDHYLVYHDTTTGKELDAFYSPQLNGQYWGRFCGLPEVFPKQNVSRVLRTLRQKVCSLSKLGMPPIYALPDGSLWTADKTGYLTGEYVYTNHQVIWNALTFIYEGQKKFGLELLRKNLALSYLTWGYTWDGPNCHSAGGDTGEVNYGWDYWFNWSIWNAPAALLSKDITALTQPGGLVHRVLEAGKQNAAG